MIISSNNANTSIPPLKSLDPITPRIQLVKPNKADFGASTICPTARLGSNTKTQATPIKYGLSLDAQVRKTRSKYRKISSKLIEPLPIKNRVAMCGCCRIDNEQNVNIKHNKQKGKASKAHYTNIMQCSNVWLCPVCASRINAKRGAEVAKGAEKWTGEGGHIIMLTTTLRHDRHDDLVGLLDGLKKATAKFWGHDCIKRIFKDIGKVGHIKNLEITYGSNGFHPHNHYAIFVSQSAETLTDYSVSYYLDDDGLACYVSPYTEKQLIRKGRIDDIKTCTLERFLSLFWMRCCAKSALKKPTVSNGLTLQCADNIRSYLTKVDSDSTGLGHELTNKDSKDSNDQFGLLKLYQNGDKQAGKLFQIFAMAIKGQRSLSWSRGLKNLLSIDDKTDEELLLEEERDAEIVAEITPDVWQTIVKNSYQIRLLELAEMDYTNNTKRLEKALKSIANIMVQNRQKYSDQLPFEDWQRLNPQKRD